MAVLDDLTPDSGLTLRRWTPDEYQCMVFPAVFGPDERLDLTEGEVAQRAIGVPRQFSRRDYYCLAELEILAPDERTELIYGLIMNSPPQQAARYRTLHAGVCVGDGSEQTELLGV